jgi:hypothetical protein
MRDDVRASRKVPTAARSRRARTVAEASDPRLRAPQPEPSYDHYDDDPDLTAPRLTLPSVPATPARKASSRPGSSGSQRTLLSRISVRRTPRRQRHDTWDEYSRQSDEWESGEWEDEYYEDAPDPRQRDRARSSARPLMALQPVEPALPEPRYEDDLDTFGQYDDMSLEGLSTDSVPNLVAYRPPRLPARRATAYTQTLVRNASNPWNVVRAILAVATIFIVMWTGLTIVGEPSQPLMSFQTNVGAASAGKITSMVQAYTQMRRPDQYDSTAQFNNWSGAACSAAVTAEVLTAWSVPKMTIGRVIDEMGSYISPNAGLLNYAGFERVAAKHGFRGDFRDNLSYSQILYIVNALGIPLIVNVRQSYGYYHYFSGGHFLVVTGGDSQGLRIVDSSLYYIQYLPKSVFYGMFTGRTELFVPQDYHYSV